MTNNRLTTLFRPTGLKELELIYRSGMTAFPPRLPEQPIFYPVVNQEYAAQIARDWNATAAPDFIGFVLRFGVPSVFAAQYPVQTVGGRQHKELWIPAEDLVELNRQIEGLIEVLEVHRGSACTIAIDEDKRMPTAFLSGQNP